MSQATTLEQCFSMCPEKYDMSPNPITMSKRNQMNRRTFLQSASLIPTSLAFKSLSSLGEDQPQKVTGKSDAMPMVSLGGKNISRLISGSNPINGGSHLSNLVNRSMKEYFMEKNTVDYFARCLEHGINIFQGSNIGNFELWNGLKQDGEKRHYISLIREPTEDNPLTIEYAKKNKFLGLAHHGEVTDILFKKKELDKIVDFLKRIRDSGLQVGISTHMPDVIDYVESKGWDIDFYMACAYERHRSAEDLKKMLGYVPLPVKEVYLQEDPPRMYKMIRQTDRVCLAFKILAAGRLCDNNQLLEKAFQDAFAGIKQKDAVIVGMFPKWTDQIEFNTGMARKYGGAV